MEKQTGRLEAFSDGIFGVAITLLAIEIGIKQYEGANNINLWHKILESWPEYFTYFNSFATVLLVWMGHNKIISHLCKVNHWIILVNGLVLLFVVFFPFPTRMVGNFFDTEAENTAVSFYAACTGLISLSLLLLNMCIINNRKMMIAPEKSIPWFKNMMRGQVIGIIIYAAAAIIAFYSITLALGITFFMWVFWAVVSKDTDEELS